jgi:outer membrane lipase/esterase
MSWGDGWRTGALRAAAIAMATLLLASCGGGALVSKFAPTRVIAFGDETSRLETGGLKYSINSQPSATDPALDCAQLPIWVQTVASSFNLPFPQCAASGAATPSQIRAIKDGKVADVALEIDTFIGEGNSFSGTDLVTVLAGTNDIIGLNTQVESAAITMDEARAQAVQLGTELANQVNRIAKAGGKVLISTIPDVSLTPYGRTTSDRSQRLSTLSDDFNSNLRVGLINDGRMIGLMLTHEAIRAIANNTTYNSTDAACDVTKTGGNVLNCTTQTMVTKDGVAATPGGWLWADDRHLSPLGQSTLGSVAVSRVSINPF